MQERGMRHPRDLDQTDSTFLTSPRIPELSPKFLEAGDFSVLLPPIGLIIVSHTTWIPEV